jgi:hypothetical protein
MRPRRPRLSRAVYFPRFTILSGGVGLKRLAFRCVLERQTFGWLGIARVLDGVNHVRHFHERLTCLECLRRLAFHFHGKGPLQHVDKPWCWMNMPSGICSTLRRSVRLIVCCWALASQPPTAANAIPAINAKNANLVVRCIDPSHADRSTTSRSLAKIHSRTALA